MCYSKECRICGEVKPLADFGFRMDNRKWRTECDRCRSERSQATRYGITVGRLRALKADANYRCQACGVHEDELVHASFKYSKLVVDHCHATGEVRGILCTRCNTALGHLDDNPVKINNLLAYLTPQL